MPRPTRSDGSKLPEMSATVPQRPLPPNSIPLTLPNRLSPLATSHSNPTQGSPLSR
jgi:hypothetical protein